MTNISLMLREIKDARAIIADHRIRAREANAAYQTAWQHGPAEADGSLADELRQARTTLLECSIKESIIEPAGTYRVLREWDAVHQGRVAALLVARDALYRDLAKAEANLVKLTSALYAAIDEQPLADRSSDVALRMAHARLFARYRTMLDILVLDGAISPSPDPRASYANLQWLCENAIERRDDLPLDKLARWLGYVQAGVALSGMTTADAERDFSRPIFHAAYKAAGIAMPETQEFQPR